MPTRNVHLTEHFDQFIEGGITSGRFSNASEIVREGLRLLEQREQEDRAKIERLRTIATEAFAEIDRGEGMAFQSMDGLIAHLDKVAEDVFTETEAERHRA